jgi:mevalonate kinase
MSWSRESAAGVACGKVILAGEHAVVHGTAALGLSLPLAVTADARPRPGPVSIGIEDAGLEAQVGDGTAEARALEALLATLGLPRDGALAEVRSDLPFGAGLGSSAALAAALARAFSALAGREPDPGALFDGVQAAERIFHGNPSGLDARLVLGGGALRFTRKAGAVSLAIAPPPLVIAHSGARGDTGAAVRHFAARLAGGGGEGTRRLEAIAALVEAAIRCLSAGDLAGLGSAMDENHEHLAWFGVSTPALDELCRAARRAGALGAKLTGGGMGGCAVALVPPGRSEAVAQAVAEAGFQVVLR